MQRIKWMADRGKTRVALAELEEALSLPGPPQRIECYDISNIQGTNSVASMVVFRDGQPASREYRRFRIKSVAGANDFASMAEVLERRFKRLARRRRELREAAAGADGEAPAADASQDGAAVTRRRPRRGGRRSPTC